MIVYANKNKIGVNYDNFMFIMVINAYFKLFKLCFIYDII